MFESVCESVHESVYGSVYACNVACETSISRHTDGGKPAKFPRGNLDNTESTLIKSSELPNP